MTRCYSCSLFFCCPCIDSETLRKEIATAMQLCVATCQKKLGEDCLVESHSVTPVGQGKETGYVVSVIARKRTGKTGKKAEKLDPLRN